MLAVLAAAIAAAASPRPVADDHCRFPPSQTAYWRTAPKNFHTNAELLAFASRFNTYEIHVGFNIRVFHYLSRSRTGKKHKEFRSVPGATAEAFAALDFELVIDGAAVAPRPLVRDGHNHTLVVRFPVAARDGPEIATLRARARRAEPRQGHRRVGEAGPSSVGAEPVRGGAVDATKANPSSRRRGRAQVPTQHDDALVRGGRCARLR